jgi:hypothetical protein
MSVQRGCDIVEYNRGKWYLFIAQDEYDFDFKTFELVGAFSTDERADDYICENYSNPGGTWVKKKPKGSKLSDYLSAWQIKAIKKLKKSGRKSMFFGRNESRKLGN